MLDAMPRQPLPPDEKPIPATYRVPPDVSAYIAERAEKEDRSINYIAVRLLRRGMEAEREGC